MMSDRAHAVVTAASAVAIGAVLVLAGILVGTRIEAERQVALDRTSIQNAFDEGFGAGSEYERWFCDNTVHLPPTTSTTNQTEEGE